MLALADWADDNGRCWPSVAAIARKVNLTEKQARRVIHGLIEDGYVRVTDNAQGGATSRRYQIRLDRLTPPADGSPPIQGSPPAHVPNPSHGREPTPPTHGSRTIIDTSVTVKEDAQASPVLSLPGIPERQKKEKTGKQTFEKWAEQIRAAGGKLIADYRPIWDYAERVGIPADWIEMAWIKYSQRYTENPIYSGKKYIDWRRHFLNAIEGNWLGLWSYNNDGECRLTTAGIQADRDTREAA